MAAPKPTPLQAFLRQLAAPRAKTTRVPKLRGATRDRASRDLEVAHLRAGFSGDAEGIVVQQYPQDNTEVPRTVDALQQAIATFRQAIVEDPTYARAYAGLADCYALLGGYRVAPADDFMPKFAICGVRERCAFCDSW